MGCAETCYFDPRERRQEIENIQKQLEESKRTIPKKIKKTKAMKPIEEESKLVKRRTKKRRRKTEKQNPAALKFFEKAIPSLLQLKSVSTISISYFNENLESLQLHELIPILNFSERNSSSIEDESDLLVPAFSLGAKACYRLNQMIKSSELDLQKILAAERNFGLKDLLLENLKSHAEDLVCWTLFLLQSILKLKAPYINLNILIDINMHEMSNEKLVTFLLLLESNNERLVYETACLLIEYSKIRKDYWNKIKNLDQTILVELLTEFPIRELETNYLFNFEAVSKMINNQKSLKLLLEQIEILTTRNLRRFTSRTKSRVTEILSTLKNFAHLKINEKEAYKKILLENKQKLEEISSEEFGRLTVEELVEMTTDKTEFIYKDPSNPIIKIQTKGAAALSILYTYFHDEKNPKLPTVFRCFNMLQTFIPNLNATPDIQALSLGVISYFLDYKKAQIDTETLLSLAKVSFKFLKSSCVHSRFFAGKIISDYLEQKEIGTDFEEMVIEQAKLLANLNEPDYLMDHLLRIQDLLSLETKVNNKIVEILKVVDWKEIFLSIKAEISFFEPDKVYIKELSDILKFLDKIFND